MADRIDDIFAGDSPEDIQLVQNMIEKIRLEIMSHGEEEYDSYDPGCRQKVEFSIQINRVTKILQEMSETLEVLFCLPLICRNEDLMDEYFNAEEQDVIRLLCKYMRSKADDGEATPSVAELSTFSPTRFIELVAMVSNKELHKTIAGQVKNLPGVYRKFLSNIREFRKFTIAKMQMTAQKDLAKEKILHRMWLSNQRNIKEIIRIEDIVEEKRASFQAEIEEKTAIIEKYRADIQRLEEQSKSQITNFIDKSNRNMFRYFEQSDNRYEELLKEANRWTKEYDTVLEEDLRLEKENRMKKARLTQQLQTWLNKYDKDAGERTKELKSLASTLRARLQEFNDWKLNDFDPQEKQYFEAIEERRLDELQAHEERVRLFMMHRAAKVLQRAWRSVAERKRKMRGRRGGRRGKGKK
ncbi:IQ domain-containing protein G-like [Aedes aegypti]|uniref:Dynein regulatory complex protein 10 n=1 Tax=Aedes aegypti TaxID=7159 RepID=A0A1S4FTI6_AEDAE|nr:IQ domain-containing protein G [Aedes aegypti]XP_021712487.1 IQ domain-containing protein G-like [Aedes aegypti]